MPISCRARSSQTGQPCKNRPIRGATVCFAHGGKARQVKAKAAERVADAAAQAMLTRIDAGTLTDPLGALAEIAGEVMRFKQVMTDIVDALPSIRFTDARGTEQLRAEVAIYERALDRCGRFLVDMAKLNIEERLARITEQQVEMVDRALTAGLIDAGLADRVTDVKVHLGRHLRAFVGEPRTSGRTHTNDLEPIGHP